MNAKEFLNNVCKEIKYKPANKPITEELEAHIEELKNDNLCKGLSEEHAEKFAVEQMGDAKKIGKRLNKIHRPKLDLKLIFLILILVGFNLSLDIFNDSNDYLWSLRSSIYYMLIACTVTLPIYFCDYRKSKNWCNIMFFTATGILLFQWINDCFSIDKIISDSMYLLNLRTWNVCIPLYIIAFAGNMANHKKEDFRYIIIQYIISCILIYWRSHSITNTLILILSYLAIFTAKMLQYNKKNIKKVFAVYGGTVSIAIIVMLLMTNIKVPYLFYGYTTEEDYAYNGYWYENSQEHEEKILNNLKNIGSTDEVEELSKSNSSHFRFLYILGKLGIIPATILAITIMLICVRLIRNSKKIKDIYGKYLIIGLGTTYIIQSIVHILMNLNLWIRSDVNMPFVAEGKLYFLINCFTFAVILSVYRRKDINFEEVKGDEVINAYK